MEEYVLAGRFIQVRMQEPEASRRCESDGNGSRGFLLLWQEGLCSKGECLGVRGFG
jgi:hypothetical protein